MTPNDIMQEVAAIGNTTVSEIDESVFYSAINRALDRANRLRPITKCISLYNHSLRAVRESKMAKAVTPDAPFEFEGKDVSAIYLNTEGSCTVTVYIDGIKAKTIDVGIGNHDHRWVVKALCDRDQADIKVSVATRGYATLISYALWRDKFSDDADDIPGTGIYNAYALKTLASDFLSLKSICKIDFDQEQMLDATEYILVGNRELWLLRSKTGRYKIEYAPTNKKISRDNANDEIGVDADIEHLIVLLTAYWVWFEDLNEIAQNCYAQYMQLSAEIKNENRAPKDPSFKNVYGW